jgi:hypothetical protein
MQASQVTVTDSPTLLFAARPYPREILVHMASGTIYVGNSNVTTSTGFKVDNNHNFEIELDANTALYGIATGATPTAYCLDTVSP